MRFGELKSIGHNIAASLASGVGLPVGVYWTDVFGEAQKSPAGAIEVDFISGEITIGTPSPGLLEVAQLYKGFLSELCARHGTTAEAFRTLAVRYGVDIVQGPHFTVRVEDNHGRSSTDRYVGWSGKRFARAQRG